MPAYDSSLFSPPAPLARVIVRSPESGASVTGIPMLLDTGADVTLVPRHVIAQLGVAVDPEKGYELMGFDGRTSVAQVANLHLEFLGKTFRGRFLLVAQEWGLLGRDVLNHLALSFDGPRLSWSEQDASGK